MKKGLAGMMPTGRYVYRVLQSKGEASLLEMKDILGWCKVYRLKTILKGLEDRGMVEEVSPGRYRDAKGYKWDTPPDYYDHKNGCRPNDCHWPNCKCEHEPKLTSDSREGVDNIVEQNG